MCLHCLNGPPPAPEPVKGRYEPTPLGRVLLGAGEQSPAAPDATAGDGLREAIVSALERGAEAAENTDCQCAHCIADEALTYLLDDPALRDVLAAAARDAEKASVLTEVADERARQDAKWGEQNHPDGTGGDNTRLFADMAKAKTDLAAREGKCTWRLVLGEEVAEAFAETEPEALRDELLQVAAVAVQWVQAIDRRALDPS